MPMLNRVFHRIKQGGSHLSVALSMYRFLSQRHQRGSLALLLLSALWFPFYAVALPETDYRFEVFLDGKPIGSHRFEFQKQAQGYTLTSTADYLVKVLFIPVYRYEHRSIEQWQDGCLVSIDAETDDNGKDYSVKGEMADSSLAVLVNEQLNSTHQNCVRTFAYWQPALLDTDRLLNSQTGNFDDIGFRYIGQTPLPWDNGRQAETIELTTEKGAIRLWYRDGLWQGLLSTLDNGRELQYRPATDEVADEGNANGEGQPL